MNGIDNTIQMDQLAPVEATEQAVPAANPNELVLVDDVDTFAGAMAQWHSEVQARMRHMLTVPDGAAFEVDGETVVIEGDVRKGFLFGLEMGLMLLGELPFVSTSEEEAEEESPPQDPTQQ